MIMARPRPQRDQSKTSAAGLDGPGVRSSGSELIGRRGRFDRRDARDRQPAAGPVTP
jgi:hypothetical protein